MLLRTRPVAVVLLMTVALCVGAQETDYRQFVVHETRVLGSGRPLVLSPDGATAIRFPEYGVIEIRTGDDLNNVHTVTYEPAELEVRQPDLDTLSWGPENRQVAFVTYKPLRFMREPDIFVLDLEPGALRCVTPDNGQDMLSSTSIDLYPVWTDDPDRLYFIRGNAGDDRSTALYSIDLTTGEPRREIVIDEQMPYAVYPRMVALSDGRVFVNRDSIDWTEPHVGIWSYRLGSNSGASEQLLGANLEPLAVPWLVELSPDEQRFIYQYAYRNSMPQIAGFSVYDLNAGASELVDPDEHTPGRYVVNAVFSPDGRGLLYVVFHNDPEAGRRYSLYVRAVGDTQPTLLLESQTPMAVPDTPALGFSPGLQWAEGGRVLLRIGSEDHLLRIGPR